MLEKLDELIAAKRELKKGLTQQYVYLRSDTKEYLVSKLYDLGRGRVISKDEIRENPGEYPVFSSQTSNKGEMGKISTYDFEGEFITWTTDGANAGKVFNRKGRFNCTNVCGTAKLTSPDKADNFYVTEYLNFVTRRYVSFVGNPKLMNGVFGSIKLKLPPLPEQQAIAEILSTADAEIDALVAKREAIALERKYLLENLVTGKIRVV